MKSDKLNLGCWGDYREGWVNLDNNINSKCDVKHDLNKFPYPFKDNQFKVILMKMVLEHVDNPLKVLEECWRISQNKCKIIIEVPHWSSYLHHTDLTHKKSFSGLSFHYFERNIPKYYSDFANFKVIKKYYKTYRTNTLHWKPYEYINKLLVEPLVNINALLTEQILCKFLSVNEINFVLEVVK